MSERSVTFHPTPNPNAGKFVVTGDLPTGGKSRTFSSPDAAADVPVAAALLRLDGVASIFMVADFITVTKRPDVDWSGLIPRVTVTIRETLS